MSTLSTFLTSDAALLGKTIALIQPASALASKPESIDLTEEDKGNAVRLDVYYSKASGKAYLQLFEYVPYKYEPCSKVHGHPLSKVEKLIK